MLDICTTLWYNWGMKAKRIRKEIKRCSICGAQLFSDIEKEFNLCPRHLHLASDNDTEPAKKVKTTKPKKAKASKRSSAKNNKEEKKK